MSRQSNSVRDDGNAKGIGNGANGKVGNHGKEQIMKKTLRLLAALALTLGIGMATARAQTRTWTGAGDMIWTQPDTNSFNDTYNSGNPVVFGSTGWGTVTIASTVTPGTITINDIRPNAYTFQVGQDNALGTASISGDNYSTLILSNTTGSEVQLANTIAQRFNPTFAFTGGDFRLDGTVNGGSNSLTLSPGAGTTVTLPNGVTGGVFVKSGAGVLRILSASTGQLGSSNGWSAGPIEVHHDQALGTSAAEIQLAFWGSDQRLIAGGEARTLANNFHIANTPLIVDGANDLTLTGVLRGGQFTKNGTGTLTLTGANSLSGQMTVNGGLLRLQNASAAYTGNLRIGGGAVVELDRNITGALGTGSGQVSLNYESGGFAAFGGNRTVNFGGAGVLVNWGDNTHFVGSDDTLVFGSTSANAQIDFQNAVNLTWDSWFGSPNKVRTIQVNDNPGSAADIAVMSGTLSGTVATYSLLKTGPGVLALAGNNTFNLPVTIAAGTLRADHANALGTGNIILAGGTLQYTATSASQDWGSRLKNSTADIRLDTNGQAISLSGIDASNTGGLTKLGTGTLTLTGTHTYTGPTTLEAGTLLINGTLAAGSPVAVNGGTLGGTGVALGAITINAGGTLAPGASIESLGSGALAFTDGSTFAYELDSASLAGDLVYVTGEVSLDGTVTLTLSDAGAAKLPVGTKLTLIASTDGWSGGLFTYLGSALADDSIFVLGSNKWVFDYNDTLAGLNFPDDQVDMHSFITMTTIPEPTAAVLLAAGGLLALKRRREL